MNPLTTLNALQEAAFGLGYASCGRLTGRTKDEREAHRLFGNRRGRQALKFHARLANQLGECEWEYTEPYWWTECGSTSWPIECNRKPAEWRYCPFCGRRIVVKEDA